MKSRVSVTKDIQKITGGLGYAFFLVGMISASTYFGFLQDFIDYEIYGDELNIAYLPTLYLCFHFQLTYYIFLLYLDLNYYEKSMAKEFEKLSKTQTFLFGMSMGFMLGTVFMMVVIG